MHTPSIDIVVVNYRCAVDTLEALGRLDAWPHGTVWLVDNSAHEDDYQVEANQLRCCLATMRWVELLTPDKNLGFGRACNLAFAQSTSDYFLLLNPDARIATKDVLELAKTLTDNARLGAVSPKIFWNEDHSFLIPSAYPQSPFTTILMALATRSRRVARWAARMYLARMAKRMASGKVVNVSFVAGSVLMLRRSSALTAGGLFDPDYFMFFEDADLSMRLRQAGFKLAIATAVSAVHEYRHKAYKAALMQQSQAKYFTKHFPTFFRLSGSLAHIAAWGKPVIPSEWFLKLAEPLWRASEFAEQTNGARVVAFSPSMLMMPALFRPALTEACCFSEGEWRLLEPGEYVALIELCHNGPRQWVHFERATTGSSRPSSTSTSSPIN